MSDPMSFPEYRELLIHINKEHSPVRHTEAGVRKVTYIECITDMRSGHVFNVKIRGYGWEKTLHTVNEHISNPKSLLQRCHEFLDQHPEAEDVDPNKAGMKAGVDHLVELLTGQFGQQAADIDDEFGVKELKFTIPMDVLKKAIQEKKNGRPSERVGEKDSDTRKQT